MARSTDSAMNPSSEAFPFPTEEETINYMHHLLDSPLIHRIHTAVSANPDDLLLMAAKLQMMSGECGAIMQKKYMNMSQRCATNDSTIKKLVKENADLEKSLSKSNHEREELQALNLKLTARVVELGGEIERVRAESDRVRTKNEWFHSENERLQGLVDGLGAKEHAIKLEAVNEFASGLRFYRRFNHFARPILTSVGQMGVGQMAKVARMPPITFELESGFKVPRAGPYEAPKLGELDFDNELTLEAWNVKELYDPDMIIVSQDGKRKANELVVRPISRPRTGSPTSRGLSSVGKRK